MQNVQKTIAQKWKYPEKARQAGIEGIVKLRFIIEENGDVSSIEITESSGNDLLDKASIAVLRNAAPFPQIPKSFDDTTIKIKIGLEYKLNK